MPEPPNHRGATDFLRVATFTKYQTRVGTAVLTAAGEAAQKGCALSQGRGMTDYTPTVCALHRDDLCTYITLSPHSSCVCVCLCICAHACAWG